LDIGCGWGGLACHIARSTGASVTGITLAEEQLNFARERARREQLENLVSFELLDYRDLKGSFDRIVSVGMFEHVGVGFYSEFFQKLHALLAENGVALLHSIGRSTGPSYTDPWIRKYIFPGGYVPALSEVLPHVEKSSLYVTDLEILRMHYAYTLKEWRKRFRENWNTSAALYDERFCRMWDLYLAGAEASFEHLGHMVFHLQMAKAHSTLPITREYMLKSEKADPIS
jgi:cyclopropane-fatty-acyl-phospholipid synthase